MSPRQVVLLTSLEWAVPRNILVSVLNDFITFLESAFTSHSQLAENTATLSLLECALRRFSPVNPLECALSKNTVGGGYSAASPSIVLISCPRVPLSTILYPLSPFFSHSCALFCTHQKRIPFIFNRFSTLYAKHPGVGAGGIHLVD